MSSTQHSAAQVRQSFFDFFQSKGHAIVPSSPVVLPSDPTLLFVNAGMNQFKDIFLGARQSAWKRVADTQKCIRVSGKHNDLEEVGRDTYHHTFFEMLGNWSFGDYYKRESLGWGWELLTKVWGLPKNRLWATVYRKDDEAMAIWREVTDIDPTHILRFDEKDNFWEMGETGPCGPCSEIHFDRTPGGCTPEQVNAGTPDVIELWNHVFIQYNRRSDGSLEELPSKHVDTGMGLERVVSVLQGHPSNYDSDLFMPLIHAVERSSGRRYTGGEEAVAMRVIADHLRTLAFAISDGVLPSNEGRGYVLRRLLRRAVRYGRKLGLARPFMAELFPVLEECMAPVFPELALHRKDILQALNAEETNFAGTLDRGIELFDEAAVRAQAAGGVFAGADAFKLYDTYGFPLDLTELMAKERGLAVDSATFQIRMQEQRTRARQARHSATSGKESDVIADLVSGNLRSAFIGYDGLEAVSETRAVLGGSGGVNGSVESLEEGQTGAIVLAATPFYPEKGGQLGDYGILRAPLGEFVVEDTRQPAEGLILHLGRMTRGRILAGDTVTAVVDADRRGRTTRHHTATHLLQWALREEVSASIHQAGSMVNAERLRFDFSYMEALTPEQIAAVERRVNEAVIANHPLRVYEMAFQDLPGSGITALFDEKYGDRVRVIDISGFSRELCGGTHVKATGEIGLFRILSESSIAGGVRRIEAVCGLPAYEAMVVERQILRDLAARFSVAAAEIPARVQVLSEQTRMLEKELRQHETASALGRADALVAAVCKVKEANVIAADVGEQSADSLKALAEALLTRLTAGVVVLGAITDGKLQFLAAVSEDGMKLGLHAGKIIKDVARIAGGGGGGQPQMARAGGKDVAKLGEAVAAVVEIVERMLSTRTG